MIIKAGKVTINSENIVYGVPAINGDEKYTVAINDGYAMNYAYLTVEEEKEYLEQIEYLQLIPFQEKSEKSK
jgi:hypothetical protein